MLFTLLSPLLWVASQCYASASSLRNMAYARKILPTDRCTQTPIISIGNLTTGGTGKTPVLHSIATALSTEHALKVVILTRGYGATTPLDYGQPTEPSHGDEAYWLQQQLPQCTVIVGKNRSKNALRAEKEYQPDVILLDDGFQHQKLHRDMDVVLVDQQRQLGNGHCLPLGPLREPQKALSRATHIAFTKGKNKKKKKDKERQKEPTKSDALLNLLSASKPTAHIPFSPTHAYQQDKRLSLNELPKQADWTLVSGIAHPADFETQVTQWLHQHSGHLKHHYIQSDHAPYTQQQIQRWESNTKDNEYLLTTEKDWPKIEPLLQVQNEQQPSLWYRWAITAHVDELIPHIMDTIITYQNQHSSKLRTDSKASQKVPSS